jgi:ribosome-associated translation inhibitor RaiA
MENLGLQITVRGMDHSDALDTQIKNEAGKLHCGTSAPVNCQVIVEKPHRHQQQGLPFMVRVHVGIPGHDFNVDGIRDEDAHVAVHEAFRAVERQLTEHGKRHRGISRDDRSAALEL